VDKFSVKNWNNETGEFLIKDEFLPDPFPKETKFAGVALGMKGPYLGEWGTTFKTALDYKSGNSWGLLPK
jgi:hypothetical protein